MDVMLICDNGFSHCGRIVRATSSLKIVMPLLLPVATALKKDMRAPLPEAISLKNAPIPMVLQPLLLGAKMILLPMTPKKMLGALLPYSTTPIQVWFMLKYVEFFLLHGYLLCGLL